MSDEGFFAEFSDINFLFFSQHVFRGHDKGQLIFQNFRGLKLGIAGHVRNRAKIQAIVQHFMRDVPRKHAVHAHLNARMLLAKFGQGREQGMNGAFIYTEGKFTALQAFEFGQSFFDFIAQIDQALGVILEKRSRIGKANGSGAANEERLSERILELADRQTNGRLGAVKAFPGSRKTALLRDHQKNL